VSTLNLNNGVHYLFDLKSKESMHLYYAVKNRHGHVLDNREEFINQVIDNIKIFIEKYDFVVFPESSSDFIEKIVLGCNVRYIKVAKNSLECIKEKSQDFNLQKAERSSHNERISNMQISFKINAMKATQRLKYKDVLFQKIDKQLLTGKGLIIDDSHFSGTTFSALMDATNIKDCLAIFSK